jgi:septum formation protein
LAREKAISAVSTHRDALIIGSDQVAYLESKVYGKPGNVPAATAQLLEMSGREVIFHTGLSLVNAGTGQHQTTGVATRVRFRELTLGEIERYLAKEDALNCAGSAKSEGLGISLLRCMQGDDPTALVGLPLIALCEMLRNEGVSVP